MEVFTLNNFISNYYKMAPKSVEGIENAQTARYYTELLELVNSCFIFSGIPDTVDENMMREIFISYTPLCIFDSQTQGILCLPAAFSGQDVYYRPTQFTISNPAVTYHGDLYWSEYSPDGASGVLIYINRYRSYFDNLHHTLLRYAEKLAQIDRSINVNLMNSAVAMVFRASSDAELKSFQEMYDAITHGKPAVFQRKGRYDDGEWAIFNNVRNTFIVPDLLHARRTIINEFLNFIGINTANTDKRERLNSDEVHANDGERFGHISEWKRNMEECFQRANKRFGLNISVEFSDVVKRGDLDVSTVVDGSAS